VRELDERDELAELIGRTMSNEFLDPSGKTAEAVIAAGYRKPRQVATAEERALLPIGTIAMDSKGNAWKRGAGSWVGTGEGGPLFDYMDLPLTVLHFGDAK
jgi:hypothetical protein